MHISEQILPSAITPKSLTSDYRFYLIMAIASAMLIFAEAIDLLRKYLPDPLAATKLSIIKDRGLNNAGTIRRAIIFGGDRQ